MKPFLKILSVILLFVLCLGAFYGSWIFLSDPSGQKFQMSLDYLKGTPFSDYFIPGLVLLVVNGIFPVFVIAALISNMKFYTWLLIAQGCILIGWLTIELIFNKDFFIPVLHFPLYSIGLFLIILGILFGRVKQ